MVDPHLYDWKPYANPWRAMACLLLWLMGALWLPLSLIPPGSGWFVLFSLLFFLAGTVLFLLCRREGMRNARLRTNGWPVHGGVLRVKHHLLLPRSAAGPWTALCQYTYQGRTYTVRSPYLRHAPLTTIEQRPTVYIDKARPHLAYVAPETIRCQEPLELSK